jgi:hypothetical protein
MLGLTVSNEMFQMQAALPMMVERKTLFLYYTEPNPSGEVRNRIYRYEWDGGGSSKFVEGEYHCVRELLWDAAENSDESRFINYSAIYSLKARLSY